jgi:hypothetical protein
MVLSLSILAVAQFGSVNVTSADTILFDGSVAPSDVNDIGFNDIDAGGQRLAEDFSFSGPVTVTSITFLGGYFPTGTPETDSFTLTIYNDNMGRPDPLSIVAQIELVNVVRTDTGTSALVSNLFTYTANFAGVSLAGGTRYWLTIVNDTTSDLDDDWVWAGNNLVDIFGRSFDGGLTWDTPPGSFSFVLKGTTTVVIDGCDSGVQDTLLPGGGTISDLISTCANGASAHDQFVSCISHVTNDLKQANTITGQQKSAIQSCAAQASIP